MSYDIDPEKRAEILETAVLGGSENINGLSLRPVTSATWSLLSRLGNSFVTGKTSDNDYSFAVYSFVYIHSQPLSKIRSRIATMSQLEADIYEFMDARPIGEAFSYTDWITRQVEAVAATITKTLSVSTPAPGDNDSKA